MDTRDKFGRLIGGSVVTCPACNGRGFLRADSPDVEVCEVCDREGLLTLPLERWTWVDAGEEGERDIYGPEDCTRESHEALKADPAAWARLLLVSARADYAGMVLEMRQCRDCGSTLAIELHHPEDLTETDRELRAVSMAELVFGEVA